MSTNQAGRHCVLRIHFLFMILILLLLCSCSLFYFGCFVVFHHFYKSSKQLNGSSFQFYCVPRTKVDNPERRLRRLVPKPCFAKCQGVAVSSKTTSFISVRILKTRDTQPGLQGVDPPHMSGVYAPRTSFPSAPRKEGGGMKEFYFCAIFWKYIFSQLFFIILRKQNFCIILRHHTTSNVELGSPKRKFPSGVGEPGPTYSSVVQV